MARLSDIIEDFIKSLLSESEGQLELQRNELADYFECAPSQINYVLATRFSVNQAGRRRIYPDRAAGCGQG